jgi:hypothetical protein
VGQRTRRHARGSGASRRHPSRLDPRPWRPGVFDRRDGLAAVFVRSLHAIAAAAQAQATLTTEAWPEDAPVRVRMGVHCGEAMNVTVTTSARR